MWQESCMEATPPGVEQGQDALQEVSEASQASNASASAAATAWRQIQQRMRPPKCKGHGEDCVIRQVKKGGANQGAYLLAFPSSAVLLQDVLLMLEARAG